MGSRGLPGFLRRTRRSDFDETDDDEEEDLKPDTPATNNGAKDQSKKTDQPSNFDEPSDSDIPPSNGNSAAQDLPKAAGATSQPSQPPSSQSSLPKSSETGSQSSLRPTILPTDRKMSYRESQYDKILSAQVVKLPELRKLGWNGIPTEHRGTVWKLLLGYLPTNRSRRKQTLERKRAEYKDAMSQHYDIDDDSRTMQEQETLRQVLVDVPRTAPDVPLFRNERLKRALGRLLYIWAMRHPASSYVQGINDLATPLFAVFLTEYYNGEDVLDGNVMVVLPDERLEEVEADVYWCLTNILAGIQDHYTADQPGVQRMVMRLEELVQRIDADLCHHLHSVGIQFIQFAFKWMNCLLLREFSLRCVIRLWDTYISEETRGFEDFHVYVCAAFLCQFSQQLQAMDFDALFGFMQEVPTDTWGETEIEMLLSQAFVLSTLFGGSEAHLTNAGSSMLP
eukprot:Nitzschia sp. Nitz4//scaffold41_size133979//104579//106082//NITZ4_003364-RA/size133979-snap-gene-0.107-mRNA-1//1//CDS//3329551521//6159//frame0